jgi:hypothetical protein
MCASSAMKKLVALKVLDHYRIWLRFNDGVEGVADFARKPHTGVYASWQDYGYFSRARIGQAGELLWDDQLEFCPDALWLEVSGKPLEQTAPVFDGSSHA